MSALFQNELDQTIVVKVDGHEKRITKREAIITQLVNRAVKGDLTLLLQMMIAYLQNIRETEPFMSTAEDDAELLRALSRLGATKEVDDGTG